MKVVADGNRTGCRQELTFKGDEKGLDDDFYQESLKTLIKTSHGSIRSYDSKVITDLGEIVLLAIKGLGKDSVFSRSTCFLPFIGD